MKYPTPNFNNQSVKLDFNGKKEKTLLEEVWIRTNVFNKRLSLGVDESVCWVISKGFGSDGASVPRPLWWWIDPLDWLILIPALAHDYLYKHKQIDGYVYNTKTEKIVRKLPVFKTNRHEADILIACKMRSFGKGFVTLVKIISVWLGVRVGGWLGYYFN